MYFVLRRLKLLQIKSGHMGTRIYLKIIDEIEGKVQFVTLASRGEPLVINKLTKC